MHKNNSPQSVHSFHFTLPIMIMHVSTSAKIVEQEQNLPFQFFSTFDMDKFRKIWLLCWEERL